MTQPDPFVPVEAIDIEDLLMDEKLALDVDHRGVIYLTVMGQNEDDRTRFKADPHLAEALHETFGSALERARAYIRKHAAFLAEDLLLSEDES